MGDAEKPEAPAAAAPAAAAPAPPAPEADALPPTRLAALVGRAKERMVVEPDRAGPASVKAMAAVVRDLKGMPELSVSREGSHRMRLGRRGKIGSIVLEYQPAIRAMELSVEGFSEPAQPGAVKVHRYTLQVDDTWRRLDEVGELFADIQEAIERLYPELG